VKERHNSEIHLYDDIFIIVLKIPFSPCIWYFPSHIKTIIFRICVLPIFWGRNPFPSLDLLEHKDLEVLLVISILGWRNLEPSFRTVLQWLQVVSNFYVINNKRSLVLIQFYLEKVTNLTRTLQSYRFFRGHIFYLALKSYATSNSPTPLFRLFFYI